MLLTMYFIFALYKLTGGPSKLPFELLLQIAEIWKKQFKAKYTQLEDVKRTELENEFIEKLKV